MKVNLHELGKDKQFKIWHALGEKENMIILFHSEGGSIVCNEQNYPIEKGAVCFVGEGRYHYTMPEPPEKYDRTKLFFSTDVLKRTLELVSDGELYSGFAKGSIVYAKLPPEAALEAEEMLATLSKEPSETYRTAAEISCLIRLIVLIDSYSAESARGRADMLGNAIEYINSNIFEDIDIDRICSRVHISKYHFCRRFKEQMGVTVMDYILKTRIILAANMLKEGDASVSEVSERCGFSSISYFCRVFKADTGLTPLKYRKKHTAIK